MALGDTGDASGLLGLAAGQTSVCVRACVCVCVCVQVVILGDTCDASGMLGLAAGADVVVHEATNAWIPGIDDKPAQEARFRGPKPSL